MSSTGRGAERAPLDQYATPDLCAQACVGSLALEPRARVLEPHAGTGPFVRALRAAGAEVWANDVDPMARGLVEPMILRSTAHDFLIKGGIWVPEYGSIDWVVGNPPFVDFERHVEAALRIAPRVAFVLRLNALGGARRFDWWAAHPPRSVTVLSPRPSFTGGGTDSCEYALVRWDRVDSALDLALASPRLTWLRWRA